MLPVVTALLGGLPSLLKDVLERVLPGDSDEIKLKRMEIEKGILDGQNQLAQQILKSDQSQLEVNKAEAANENLFVSGWRPACGWVCVIALAYTFVLGPIANDILVHFGLQLLPSLNIGDLNTILFGMLGLGGLRTVEKISDKK